MQRRWGQRQRLGHTDLFFLHELLAQDMHAFLWRPQRKDFSPPDFFCRLWDQVHAQYGPREAYLMLSWGNEPILSAGEETFPVVFPHDTRKLCRAGLHHLLDARDVHYSSARFSMPAPNAQIPFSIDLSFSPDAIHRTDPTYVELVVSEEMRSFAGYIMFASMKDAKDRPFSETYIGAVKRAMIYDSASEPLLLPPQKLVSGVRPLPAA